MIHYVIGSGLVGFLLFMLYAYAYERGEKAAHRGSRELWEGFTHRVLTERDAARIEIAKYKADLKADLKPGRRGRKG